MVRLVREGPVQRGSQRSNVEGSVLGCLNQSINASFGPKTNEKRMKIMTENVSNNQCSVSFTGRRDLSFLAIQTLNIVHCSWSEKIKDHVRRQRRTRVADLDEEGVGPSIGFRER